MTLWYLSGFYLIFLGLFLFLNDVDILVGFLWVIDSIFIFFFITKCNFENFKYNKFY